MNPITLEKDREGGWLVTQGNLDSGCLSPDEALGIIAHALYGDGTPHRFLRPKATPPPEEQELTDEIAKAIARVIIRKELDRQLGKPPLYKVTIEPGKPQTVEQLAGEQMPGAWIKWNGGRCPVPAGTMVDYRLLDGTGGTRSADELVWSHGLGDEGNIIAFRPHKPEQPGIDSEGSDHD